MVDILSWLLAVELLGILVLPLCFVLFRRLPDRGITLAKPLALVLFSYVLWIAGLSHVVPNTRLTLIVILLAGTAVSWLVFRASIYAIIEFLKQEWRTLLVAEAVFLVFFALWLSITSEAPAINHTEKPMDFGFMNAVLQSRFFPPEDPWLAGHSISYYYFGHFMMAFLAKLSAVPSSVGYNLALSTVPALLAIGSFGLLYNLVRLSGGSRKVALGFGLAAPAIIVLIGNLEGALEFVHAQGWGGSGFWSWVGIDGLEGGAARTADGVWKWVGGVGGGAAGSSGAFPDQPSWWWNATRVMNTFADGRSLDYTITEFPMFSFILGDLHAHVMSLPFIVLALSLGLNLFQSEDRLGLGWLRCHPIEAGAVALFVGSLAFINIWDLPMMAGVLAVLVVVKSYGEGDGDLQRSLFNGAVVLVPILLLGVVLFLPFYLTLGGQATGILPLQDISTRPFLFLMTMGLFSVVAVSFVFRQLPGLRWPTKAEAPASGLVLAVALAPLVVWTVIALSLKLASDGLGAAINEVGGRAWWVLPGLAIAALAAFSGVQHLRQGRDPTSAFTLVLIAVAFYLLAGAELFYVADFFGGAFRRMNTIFKVYYQSWLLLGIASAYGLYYWRSHWPRPSSAGNSGGRVAQRAITLGNYAWIGGVGLLLVASAYYSVGAVLDRTGVLSRGHTLEDNTLNGLAFVRDQDPGEYSAIKWLRDTAPWGRIVEAVGDDYSAYGRVSSSTGLPTVLGWKGHELQWRGTSRIFEGREEDVAQIYQSPDEDQVRSLLEGYGVRYVYYGQRERKNYGAGHLARFDSFLKTAFTSDSVIIYELVNGAGLGAQGEHGQGSG